MTEQPWKRLTIGDRTELAHRIYRMADQRLNDGLINHGPVFQSEDLLDDAEEEMLDTLNYLAVARRERDWLRRRTSQLADLLIRHGIPTPDTDAAPSP